MLPPVMLPVLDTRPPVRMFPCVALPVELIIPPVKTLPPVTLPDVLIEVPVITPPTTEAAVTVPVTLRLVPVAAPMFGVTNGALAGI